MRMLIRVVRGVGRVKLEGGQEARDPVRKLKTPMWSPRRG